MRGKLIVFEGIDGSGKSTALKYTKKMLKDKGFKVSSIKFPTQNNKDIVSSTIQDFLFGKIELTSQEAAYLFEIDRLKSKKTIEDMLEKNDFVLLDRYVHSNIALQGARIISEGSACFKNVNEFSKYIYHFAFNKLKLTSPDITLIMDIPLKTSDEKALSNKEKDLLESDQDVRENSYNIYQDVIPKLFENTYFIKTGTEDGFRDKKEILEDIKKHILGGEE